jgi:hypothetical protein
MQHRGKLKVALAVMPALGLALAYAGLIALSPLPFNVMDRDNSGLISLGEALDAHDIGQRPIAKDPGCVEYFWLKDGSVAYVACRAGA